MSTAKSRERVLNRQLVFLPARTEYTYTMIITKLLARFATGTLFTLYKVRKSKAMLQNTY